MENLRGRLCFAKKKWADRNTNQRRLVLSIGRTRFARDAMDRLPAGLERETSFRFDSSWSKALQSAINIASMSEVTRILESMEGGDPKAAEELLPLVYEELRRLAATRLAMESPGQTLQATALVHEAWIRLSSQRNQNYQNRHAFFGVAAEVMRRILVDRARRRQAARHGGGQERVELDAVELPAADDELIQDVNEVLDALAELDSQKAEIVKLHFFAGLSFEEIASLLGVHERTVRRHWIFAKAWMCKELGMADRPSPFLPVPSGASSGRGPG